ncbi:MAG: class I SAM-dependent DNA methyltransferase [Sterolibacteriaceae bacterium]|nr:class I SAM-dependent DNA methyltransferase [Sterolibacteriaceae bacterium]
MSAAPEAATTVIEDFVARWQHATGSELANAQLFVTELARLLDLPQPDPAREDTRENKYVFERRVRFRHGDGSESEGRIDCYRRGAFVLEAKRLRQNAAKGFDDAMLRARAQAEAYARALPAEEGRPPFLLVVDVGHAIEFYAEFTRSGATYTPFPDPRSHRIRLADLRSEAVRERLRAVWLDPLALDPARVAARATREVAAHLAEVARSLEAAGHTAEVVAGFLTRCLFSMFAEDVGLLPKNAEHGAFVGLLDQYRAQPDVLGRMLHDLWRAMDRGEFAASIAAQVLHFNGKLFKNPDVLPLSPAQIDRLLEAARADWQQVEPAIFGTLLERALDPAERHALGAHYTPRAYVERLVLPTVVEPLRADWADVQAAAMLLAGEGEMDAARSEVRKFHHALCSVRVLDPACGSGNFLYVTLEHLKRLEGEVLNQLDALGDTQGRLEASGLTVDPHQFLGLEINPRAAAIAELVLWIGYLQWHFRTRGAGLPPQPVLKDFRNIECRDAVLACERIDFLLDQRGIPVTRWDGKTMKPHPVTGAPVPDEAARMPIELYVNPRKAEWPEADFVVGNPPFIGAGPMRAALGDGYVEALRGVWQQVPDSADFVMFWWHHAADLTLRGRLRRFGFITTNSLRQTFNRRVVAAVLDAKPPLSLAFAIPDHPWVDSTDGAAVRIAMTVGVPGAREGRLLNVIDETAADEGEFAVKLAERNGKLHADLSAGADVAGARALRANENLSSPGVKLHGAGFIVEPEQAAALGLGKLPGLEHHVRPYRNGRDLTDSPRGVMLIDLFGLSAEEVRQRYPAVYQWVAARVKPERDAKAHTPDGAGYARLWWLPGKPRQELRRSLVGLTRYIATTETSKHRMFQFLDTAIAPDNMLICIALDDAFHLGVLASAVHVIWALAAGGRLGVGNDPRYNKSRCFDPFPFPDATPEQQSRIRALAEELDAHRKRVQASTSITLTQMYNVLEALRAGRPLSTKERAIHDAGLVGVLAALHDEIDREVLSAYGWDDLAGTLRSEAGRDQVLARLVALNALRAAQEANGEVHWLRPEYQCASQAVPAAEQGGLDLPEHAAPESPVHAASRLDRLAWPAELPAQVAAVAGVLAQAAAAQSLDELAARFSGRGKWRKRLPQIIETLVALGRAREAGPGRYIASAA